MSVSYLEQGSCILCGQCHWKQEGCKRLHLSVHYSAFWGQGSERCVLSALQYWRHFNWWVLPLLWNRYQINPSQLGIHQMLNVLYTGVSTDHKFDDISSLDGNFPVESELPDVIFYYRWVLAFSGMYSLYSNVFIVFTNSELNSVSQWFSSDWSVILCSSR